MKPLLIIFFSLTPLASEAAVIFNNLSAKNTSGNVFRRAAQAFYTTYDSYIVTDLRLIGYGTSPDIRISIFSTSGGYQPQSRIATLYAGSTADAGFRTNLTSTTPTNFTFSPVVLSSQTQYWIVVEDFDYYSGSGLTWGATLSNNTAYGDGYSTMARNSLSETSWGSFESNPYVMKVTAVPEPNSMIFLGLASLMTLRRSRSVA